jgi:hypothetical protein
MKPALWNHSTCSWMGVTGIDKAVGRTKEDFMALWVWVLIIVLLVLLLTGGIYVRR